jgi:hypothetical protein
MLFSFYPHMGCNSINSASMANIYIQLSMCLQIYFKMFREERTDCPELRDKSGE